MMTIDNLTNLFMAHLRGDLSDAAQEELNQWLARSDRNRRLFASINDEEQLRQLVLSYYQETEEDNEAIILSKIRARIGENSTGTPVRPIYTQRRWIWLAASLLIAVGIGGYLLLNKKEKPQAPVVAGKPADIPPGHDGAVLTLADGSQVVLDSLGNGVIATQNGTQVVLNNGALAYTKNDGSMKPVYNYLFTPRGRQFQLLLPDGTKAWLNAASSLRYPTVFTGNTREVEVTGEVYFEVAKNAQQPFIINVNKQMQVLVLGTHFNINAYDDEPAVKTTLLEGSLKVTAIGSRQSAMDKMQEVILKPGQQAVLGPHLPLAINYSPDIDKAIAWKSGVFNFEDAKLEEVMRQIGRWYDIEVVYEKGIPDIVFGGKMTNDVSLSGLLRSLQEMDVHFRVEGRKLIVLP